MDKLIEEIIAASAGFRDTAVTSVFVGGGTPSILESQEVLRIFDALYHSFNIEETAEISMEANPGTSGLSEGRDQPSQLWPAVGR